jgi:hypothetical protein
LLALGAAEETDRAVFKYSEGVPQASNDAIAVEVLAKFWACQKPDSTVHCLGGDVAQGLEQSAHNRLVAGSNPAIPTKQF